VAVAVGDELGGVVGLAGGWLAGVGVWGASDCGAVLGSAAVAVAPALAGAGVTSEGTDADAVGGVSADGDGVAGVADEQPRTTDMARATIPRRPTLRRRSMPRTLMTPRPPCQ